MKCKFIAYHTEEIDGEDVERVLVEAPFSEAGWAQAIRKAARVFPDGLDAWGHSSRVEVQCGDRSFTLSRCSYPGEINCFPTSSHKADSQPLAGTQRKRKRRR